MDRLIELDQPLAPSYHALQRGLAALPNRPVSIKVSEPDQPLSTIRFSASGAWVAVAQETGLSFWSTATANLAWHSEISLPQGKVAFSADEQQVAVASPGDLVIWNVSNERPKVRLTGLSLVSMAPVFGPKGAWIALVSDTNVVIVDTQSGKIAARLEHDERVLSAKFHDEGSLISTQSANQVGTWDIESANAVARLSGGGDWRPEVLSESGHLFGVIEGRQVNVFDTANEQLVATVNPSSPTLLMAFSPSDDQLVTSGAHQSMAGAMDSVAETWRLNPVYRVSAIYLDDYARAIKMGPKGRRLIIESRDAVNIWDTASAAHITPADKSQQLRLSPDGKWLASSMGTTIALSEAHTGRATVVLEHKREIWWSKFSQDGSRMFAFDGQFMHVWNLATARAAFKAQHRGQIFESAMFSADASRLMALDRGGSIMVWDIEEGKVAGRLAGAACGIKDFSRDGRTLIKQCGYTLGGARQVTVWHVDSRHAFRITRKALISEARFQGDGQTILTRSGEKWDIWDANTGELLSADVAAKSQPPTLSAAQHGPWQLAIAPSDNGGGSTVSAFRAGEEVLQLSRGNRSAAISADGRWVASVSQGGTLDLWPGPPSALIEEACRRVVNFKDCPCQSRE